MPEELQPDQQSPDRNVLVVWLSAIQRKFDPPLEKARDRYSEPQGWIGIWLLRSLFGAKYEKMSEEGASGILNALSGIWQKVVTVLLLIGAVSAHSAFDFHLPIWGSLLAYAPVALSLIISLYANLARMLTLTDPYFNSNAYKLFRKQEYLMFLPYFRETKLTFKDVKELVHLMYRENALDVVVAEHEKLHEKSDKLIEHYEKTQDQLARQLKKAEEDIDKLKEYSGKLLRLSKANEEGFNSAISTLYRLRSGDSLFGYGDLRVVSDFSLFEYEDPYLIRICEQGTTETPSRIDIHDPDYQHYSSVKLVRGSNTIEYATSDREGRTVASYWIELPSKRVLVYNFHYDSTFKGMSDIINTKEMYRYIRGICILLEDRGLIDRGGTLHGSI